MAEPYIAWFTADFLSECAELAPEEIGVYAILRSLMGEKDGPVENDPQWLARRCNCSTRQFNAILKRLVSTGLVKVRNGVLANDKMLREVHRRRKKSNQASSAADTRWRKYRAERPPEDVPELPLGDDFSSAFPQSAEDTNGQFFSEKKSEKKREKKTPQISDKSQTSANPSDADASGLARARDSDPYISTTHPTESLQDRARENDLAGASVDSISDITHLLETVSEAAGFVPRGADRYAEALDFVREWRTAGISFDAVVLPVIREVMAETKEPTNSLKRFDWKIRQRSSHETATAGARKSQAPSAPTTPPDLIFEFEDEDEAFIPLRRDLAKALGPFNYQRACHGIRFSPAELVNGKVRLESHFAKGTRYTMPLLDGEKTGAISRIVKKHGYAYLVEARREAP